MAREGAKDRGIMEWPRGSAKWWASYAGADGKMHREFGGAKSAARKLYELRKTEIREGRWFPSARRRAALFDDLVENYRTAKEREGKSIMNTAVGFNRLLDRFGGRRADSVTADEVERWRADLLAAKAPATVNRNLALLRAIMRRGARDRRIAAAAIPEIKLLKENNFRVRYLSDVEEHRLLAALPVRLRPLVIAAIHTGMRRGELLNLKWQDVDFVSGTIFVSRSKSGEGRRIPMSPTARDTLEAMRGKRRARRHLQVVDRRNASPYVFTAPRGGMEMNLARSWYPALERAELDDLRFHDLRHTFASRLVMMGVPLYEVQTLLGHKTPAMTLRYAHLSPANLRAAVARLDAPGPKPWAVKSEKVGAG
ncbi:MAG TPA: site-specific integrase [Candidatus Binataceae bacterium]|nr:site-specific integrase [Candidatus Binataceae bacterium]